MLVNLFRVGCAVVVAPRNGRCSLGIPPRPSAQYYEAKGLLLTYGQTMVTRQIEHYCDWEYIHDPVREFASIHFDQGVSLTPCQGV